MIRSLSAAETAPTTYPWVVQSTALRVKAGRRMAVNGLDLSLVGQSVGGRIDLRSVRRAIGYLPQEFGFYPRFTVREFVEYMAWLKEMPSGQIAGAVQRAVERVGLADRADDRMRTLS